MNKNKILRTWALLTIVTMLLAGFGVPTTATAQSTDGVAIESESAIAAAPVMEEAVWTDEVPELTDEQIAQMEWAVDNTHLAPPLEGEKGVSVDAPPGSESVLAETRDRSGEPMAPGDPTTYRWKQFGGSIPAGYKSNVMESSIDGKSKRLFYTGNWFTARSTNKGVSWTYLSAYTGFPDFCCDQSVIHDTTRDIYLWLRQGVGYTDTGGNYENVFKLSVAFANPFSGAYWTYTFQPMDVNSGWTNQWWDYPHMQLGADYLYIAYNMFNSGGSWTRSVMLRFPLDSLAAGAGFSFNYYNQSTYFTYVPVSGAQHAMYFASNWGSTPYDHLRIWRWYEDSTGLVYWDRTVTAWTGTGTGDAHCGTPNWTGRLDMRVMTGARYMIYNSNLKDPGRTVLGWWWNVAEGGSFPHPYIEGAAFYEDGITQVAGNQGRPLIWNSTNCFAYPSIAPNHRQDLGAIFNFSTSAAYQKPNTAYAIADDYSTAPAGWTYFGAAGSNAGPSDNKWGDYNTTRSYQRLHSWIAAAHYIANASNCATCAEPFWFAFGRERDIVDFLYW